MTDNEKQFISYWEASRLKEKRLLRQLVWGGGSGILFVIIMLLSVMSGWHKQVNRISPSLLVLLLVCMLVIAGFYAVVRMRIRWDKQESYYQSLKLKYGKAHASKK